LFQINFKTNSLIGRKGAFVNPHSHEKGWNKLFYGKKKWILT